MASYPRPDFLRPSLNWRSLNGPWSFIFDDNDVGAAQNWHLNGLPESVTVDPALGAASGANKDAESITARITGDTQELIKGNFEWKKDGEQKKVHEKRTIEVPYVWQCAQSGIEEKGVHEVFWYEREVVDIRSEGEKKEGRKVLLRFGAVDYEARVYVDGKFVGGHRGGHVPWDVDVTDALSVASVNGDGKYRLTMRVFDSAHDLTQPRGKQYWGAQPESIFYTPSGGIWQSVWLEVVPSARIGDSSAGTVLQSTDIEGGKLKASVKILGRLKGWGYSAQIEVSLGSVLVSKTEKVDVPRDVDLVALEADTQLSKDQLSQLSAEVTEKAPLANESAWHNDIAIWSPEHPTLYDLTIRLFSSTGTQIDEIQTTTGMRTLSWTDSKFQLNNKPYFQALFLDQGYWPTTFMTPPTPTALKEDIELSKRMGFNGCRKHQKVEDPLFFYWADRLGFLVWGEMANAYQFSPEYVERFDQEWTEAVLRDRNHPSVIAWTPVNESWAYTDLAHNSQQRDHIRSLYYRTKTLDPTRPINDNCGWEHVLTDLTTFHDYSDVDALTNTCASLEGILASKADRGVFLPCIPSAHAPPDPETRHRPGAPIICTEFGGVNVARVDEEGKRDWGYTTASDPKDLLARIEKMMVGIVGKGLIGGFVYTQLTDIEQEVNGLYTPERREKLDSREVRAIVERVRGVYFELLK
ncbi:glycoside hydrolase [Massarina eburnea CBS 473.64]|uniref:Glycoside hydrolase n=1 Tax=Massarina eburnea CBS 473.64 TaxID=1395130 RepID=A0A6A6SFX2_9PLEO|nr:glycoside hydrolase [Massarina eburnea CBS 473.64]